VDNTKGVIRARLKRAILRAEHASDEWVVTVPPRVQNGRPTRRGVRECRSMPCQWTTHQDGMAIMASGAALLPIHVGRNADCKTLMRAGVVISCRSSRYLLGCCACRARCSPPLVGGVPSQCRLAVPSADNVLSPPTIASPGSGRGERAFRRVLVVMGDVVVVMRRDEVHVGVLFTSCLPRRVLASHQRQVPCDASVSLSQPHRKYLGAFFARPARAIRPSKSKIPRSSRERNASAQTSSGTVDE
jgi:hypothetical protein